MQAGDIVTIAPPFGDGATEFVVSGVLDADTSLVQQGEAHLAFGNHLLTKVGTGGVFVAAAGPRRLTKLQFVERLGADFDTLFSLSKTHIELEKFMKLIDWATPDPDGTSIDLDDPRVVGALDSFAQMGLMTVERVQEVRA